MCGIESDCRNKQEKYESGISTGIDEPAQWSYKYPEK